MRVRPHLTYANVMATLAVFGVLGGGAYAASRIGTEQLKRKAVTSPKLAPAAVTTNRLDAGTEGVALSGANVAADGTLLGSFDRLSGSAPTVLRASVGVYDVSIPGLGGLDQRNYVHSAVITDTSPSAASGEIAVRWDSCSGFCATHPEIFIRDNAGHLVDRSFSYLLFGATKTG